MSGKLNDADEGKLVDVINKADFRFLACDNTSIKSFGGVVDIHNELASIQDKISDLRECIGLLVDLHDNPCGGDFNIDVCIDCRDYFTCKTYDRIKEILYG